MNTHFVIWSFLWFFTSLIPVYLATGLLYQGSLVHIPMKIFLWTGALAWPLFALYSIDTVGSQFREGKYAEALRTIEIGIGLAFLAAPAGLICFLFIYFTESL